MSQRIGLYGGSFDPIHFGHLISARNLAEQMGLSRVVLIPSARPPHKDNEQVSDAAHRLEMTRLAIADEPLFEVSDIELRRQGPSYTFDTIAQLREAHGDQAELFWIIGADTLPELPTWYRIAELVTRVTIVTAKRPGFDLRDNQPLIDAVGTDEADRLIGNCYITPEIDISATDIRRRVGAGLSIRFLTPEPVRSYISARGLYQGA